MCYLVLRLFLFLVCLFLIIACFPACPSLACLVCPQWLCAAELCKGLLTSKQFDWFLLTALLLLNPHLFVVDCYKYSRYNQTMFSAPRHQGGSACVALMHNMLNYTMNLQHFRHFLELKIRGTILTWFFVLYAFCICSYLVRWFIFNMKWMC